MLSSYKRDKKTNYAWIENWTYNGCKWLDGLNGETNTDQTKGKKKNKPYDNNNNNDRRRAMVEREHMTTSTKK